MYKTQLHDRVVAHLARIYADIDHDLLAVDLIETFRIDQHATVEPHQNHWDESDIALITYGDSLLEEQGAPLTVLCDFLREELRDTIAIVHILPFFPYSSDDGFSVIDYSSVNESLGSWKEVEAIAQAFKLMADVVINHMSSRSLWFDNYKNGRTPGKDYFIDVDPGTDLTAVVRPRTSPVLAPVETSAGLKHVWCTFSHDQVDLNFANPQVLIEFAKIIIDYLDHGIRWFRLDAVAFLWKEIGTPCIHLPQTHEIIKLLRLLIEHKCSNAVIITETNVPNRENLTYFGNGNEAHLIYNFSLPPLLIHTLITGDCRHLKTWQMSMPPAQHGTTYFNFIASHDGIGVRPAEGIMAAEEIDNLIETMTLFGGQVTYRDVEGGDRKPYEINIALIDALSGTSADGPDSWCLERFLCAHTIMLALEGVPAFYLHSLLATPNDIERVEHTGRLRSINRHQWSIGELRQLLSDPNSINHQVFATLKHRCAIRACQTAFHPNATQYTLHLGTAVFGFWRQSMRREQSIFALHNVTAKVQTVALDELNLIAEAQWVDLIARKKITDRLGELSLQPYECVWLTNELE